MTSHASARPGSTSAPEGLFRIDRRLGAVEYLRRIWAHREFALTIALGELKGQHMNTFLGGAWHLLNPIILAAVYYFVFGVVLNARRGVENYTAFLVCGLFVFHYTQKCLTTGSTIVVSNLNLIRSVYFPRGVLPVASIMSQSLAQVPALAVLILLVLATGEPPSAYWFLLIPVSLLQSIFNLGLAMFVARLTFHFRDFTQIVPFITRVWLYVSGVFFAIEQVPDGPLRTVLRMNPMASLIGLTRQAMMDSSTSLDAWLSVVAWTVGSVTVGYAFFRARESDYGLAY